MKKIWVTGVILVLCVFFSINTANASSQIKGTSLGEFSTCDYYLIEDSLGDYSLVEWYGGITPDNGDRVVGELHSYGFKDIYNISRDNSTHVWIDDWMLSQDSAAEKLIDKCGYNRIISTYFETGYITYPVKISPTIPVCPLNSSYAGGKCGCNDGYLLSGNSCITYKQSCQIQFGVNAYGDEKFCYCEKGYQWNLGKTSCVQIAPPTCLDGYVLDANNKCISYTESCRTSHNGDLNILGMKNGDGQVSCVCVNGYVWNGSKCATVLVDEKLPVITSTKKNLPKIEKNVITKKISNSKSIHTTVQSSVSTSLELSEKKIASTTLNVNGAIKKTANPSIYTRFSSFLKKFF